MSPTDIDHRANLFHNTSQIQQSPTIHPKNDKSCSLLQNLKVCRFHLTFPEPELCMHQSGNSGETVNQPEVNSKFSSGFLIGPKFPQSFPRIKVRLGSSIRISSFYLFGPSVTSVNRSMYDNCLRSKPWKSGSAFNQGVYNATLGNTLQMWLLPEDLINRLARVCMTPLRS